MTRLSKSPRNKPLARGIEALSRTDSVHARGRWSKKITEWKSAAKPASAAGKKKVKKFGKDETETREVSTKTPRFYPVEQSKKRLPSRKSRHHAPRVRKSLHPGVIAIILSGKFRGKRVVVLKVLPSGLLVVTGPYTTNGVPLRRVNPAYVIATATSIDLAGFTLDSKFNDAYFAKPKSKDTKKSDEDPFASSEKKKKEINPQRVEDQKLVDKHILEVVGKTQNLGSYLAARFSLSRHQYPHLLKF